MTHSMHRIRDVLRGVLAGGLMLLATFVHASQFAAYYGPSGSVVLAPVQGAASPIPSGLVIAPGTYSYNSPAYDMTQEGLYRFSHPASAAEPWEDATNRIVYNGDVDKLLSSLSYLLVHGTRDEGFDLSTRLFRLLTYFKLPEGKEDRAAWVLSLSPYYRVVPANDFDAMFYPSS